MTKQLCGEDAEPCCRLGRCAHLSLLISHPTAATYALGHAVKTEYAGKRKKKRDIASICTAIQKSRDDNDNERHTYVDRTDDPEARRCLTLHDTVTSWSYCRARQHRDNQGT